MFEQLMGKIGKGGGLPSKISGTMSPYYRPYIESGSRSLPTLEEQYNKLISNPYAIMEMLSKNFQSSPGYDFTVSQATRAANQAASAGGMLGSPMHQQQSAQMAEQLANQEYGNYLNNMMGLYGQGIGGLGGLTNLGYSASNELAQSLANALLSQAQLDYAKKANKQSSLGSIIGGGLGLLGSFLF